MDPFTSATDLARQIRTKKISPVEVVDAYLSRIDESDPDLNAFVVRDDEAIRASAREAERAVFSGTDRPFLGVPVPIKNLSDVAGQPNDQCSLAVDERPRERTAPAVQRLIDAGFLPMGRTNSPEFGPLTVSENRKYGATRNPWDRRFTPGGSSGGAAAAVAAGFAPLAHASDGGGSIRVPSSCCGLVGLKPSRGRVPQAVAGWEHSTVEGVVTRTVEDAAAVLDVMSAIDYGAWYSAPVSARSFADSMSVSSRNLRVGLMLSAPTGLSVDQECAEAATRAAELLERLGHEVIDAAPRLYSQRCVEDFQVIISAWTGSNVVADESLLDNYIRYRFEQGRKLTASQYAMASARMQEETRDVVGQWGQEFDVLLTPTMATTTPRVGVVYDEANADPSGDRETEIRMISFTSFANMSGQPALSLPVHCDADGLPVGAQLVAAPFREDHLFQLATALEAELRWFERTPDSAVCSKVK